MEAKSFDTLARRFAGKLRRRSLLAVLAGMAAPAAVGEASAATTQCRDGRQTCQRNAQCCSGTCNRGRDVLLKHRNRCACTEQRPDLCGNACVALTSDERNCGSCGTRCDAGMVCLSGVCTCVPTCYGTNCGGDDGCGGTCPPHVDLGDDDICVDGDTYCESNVWRTGDRADCFVSPQGEVMFGCYNVGAGFDYDWGSTCTQTSNCQAWCDGVTNYGCICVAHQHYADYTSGVENYSGQGGICVRKILKPFDLEEAIAGECGSWA